MVGSCGTSHGVFQASIEETTGSYPGQITSLLNTDAINKFTRKDPGQDSGE
jgi:hypothetical protein